MQFSFSCPNCGHTSTTVLTEYYGGGGEGGDGGAENFEFAGRGSAHDVRIAGCEACEQKPLEICGAGDSDYRIAE